MNFTPCPSVAVDYSYQAVNWATFAGSVVTILGILFAGICSFVVFLRQNGLIVSHKHLHTKVDGLTPQSTPSASAAMISHASVVYEPEIVLKKGMKKSA